MDLARPVEPARAPGHDASDRTLPAWTYFDQEFFELERERIFMRSWQLVCHANDIPAAGDYHTFSLLGESAIVIRDESGALRAFHNVCRHRAARLLDGDRGRCERHITCPYHAWSYAFDGRLVGIPFKTQYPQIRDGDYGLVPIDCTVFLGFVFIRFTSGGVDLAEGVAPMEAEMRLYRIESLQPLGSVSARRCQTNWKNACDNYIDALHVRVAHRGLDSLVGNTYGMEVRTESVYRLWGSMEDLPRAGLSVRAYREVLPPVEFLPEQYRRMWLYYLLWPNLTFNLYPDQVEFLQFLPLSPVETLVRDAAYGYPDERPAMRTARALNLRINRRVGFEDKDLIERVQAGVTSSSFTEGVLGRNEVCLRAYAARMRATLPVSRLRTAPPRGTVAACNERMS
ncbi:MAG: Carnitine monooxygenase oxygenase subunit [Gammaproteobacteria bacterium]|nr:Carnitine monooxygenase oxygenase subunit [Gammaproteobacteria bacterium]